MIIKLYFLDGGYGLPLTDKCMDRPKAGILYLAML